MRNVPRSPIMMVNGDVKKVNSKMRRAGREDAKVRVREEIQSVANKDAAIFPLRFCRLLCFLFCETPSQRKAEFPM